MTDPTIWDNWAPPTTDNEWSREAAASMIGAAGTIRRAVAAYVAVHHPIAEWEIEQGLMDGWLKGSTIRPRLVELQRAGIIEKAPYVGRTPSGRKCGTYRITSLGNRLLAL